MSAVVASLDQARYAREKRAFTAKAKCCMAGIVMTTAHDDHGRERHVLSRGEWTSAEMSIEQVEEFIARGGVAGNDAWPTS